LLLLMLLLLPLRQAVDEDDDDGRVVGRDLAGRDPNTLTRTRRRHTHVHTQHNNLMASLMSRENAERLALSEKCRLLIAGRPPVLSPIKIEGCFPSVLAFAARRPHHQRHNSLCLVWILSSRPRSQAFLWEKTLLKTLLIHYNFRSPLPRRDRTRDSQLPRAIPALVKNWRPPLSASSRRRPRDFAIITT
jgi:hypothetical protein